LQFPLQSLSFEQSAVQIPTKPNGDGSGHEPGFPVVGVAFVTDCLQRGQQTA
jgi:hypothetical protein